MADENPFPDEATIEAWLAGELPAEQAEEVERLMATDATVAGDDAIDPEVLRSVPVAAEVREEAQAEEKHEDEDKRLIQQFMAEMDVDEEIAMIFVQEGFTSVEEVAYVPIEELNQIEEFDEDLIQALRSHVRFQEFDGVVGVTFTCTQYVFPGCKVNASNSNTD